MSVIKYRNSLQTLLYEDFTNICGFLRIVKYSDVNKDLLEQTQKALIRKKCVYIYKVEFMKKICLSRNHIRKYIETT